jgi:hypothetical protein
VNRHQNAVGDESVCEVLEQSRFTAALRTDDGRSTTRAFEALAKSIETESNAPIGKTFDAMAGEGVVRRPARYL